MKKLKNRFRSIFENKFVKSVSILASGSIISQLVVLASSTALSRLFSVSDFGYLSLFTSISTFFAVLSTGRFELAIGLPESDSESKKIIQLIIYTGSTIAGIYFVGIVFLKDLININDSTGFLHSPTAYLAPIYIFFVAIYSALGYWFQRKKDYKLIAFSSSLQVIATALISIVFGLLHFSHGMIYSLLFGIAISTLFLFFKDRELSRLNEDKSSVLQVMKKYIYFPKYMIVSDLSLSASQQFIPIIFSALYNATTVGFFAMANRIIRLPNILITSSIGNVFRNEAIDEIRKSGNCKALYLSTLKKLAIISGPIYLAIFIVAPYIFLFFFGAQWVTAGYYARILCLMLAIEFVVLPLNTLFNIYEKQKIFMKLQILNAVCSISLIYMGYYWFKSAAYSLVFFSLNSIIFNLVFLSLTYKIVKNAKENI
ncbi:oligosaccharide flippase family protein [Pedobacter sp. HDW13]|uniref:oligosaccharide flippase family protein n=1 Tax=Pedobacter sp. HDW13 TaxID=2714940 RepID=UPI00140B2EC0|nr:oligosaccharide flippase family protein [Pedobacter sp. HDW13]QIL39215.1 oligosaccharide flippase family protein [Pedobacter sp. HDW13]